MKIIITENQYNKLILRRRLSEIMNEALMMVENGDVFYGDIDFCYHYPKFYTYMEGMVDDIIDQYHNETEYSVSDFIYNEIGLGNFINMLIDEHGDEIRSFYNMKTKDC